MLPVGPLMVEHRLIERMIALMAEEVRAIRQGRLPDAEFIRDAIDFIRTYADRLHHGKEENILFRDLAKKQLSAEHAKIMAELVTEHGLGRKNTQTLFDARNRFLAGEKESVQVIADAMGTIAAFYPRHIEKEDKHFFLPVMEYFTAGEQAAMLAEFEEFDRRFVHSIYKDVVSKYHGKA